MPPKRKQVDDSGAEASSSTRSTRASTRAATAKNTAKGAASSSGTTGSGAAKNSAGAATPSSNGGRDGDDSDAMESVHSTKRARTSGSASTKMRKSATKASGRAGAQMEIDDEPNHTRKSTSRKELPLAVSNSRPVVHAEPAPTAKPSAKKASKIEPYTPHRSLALFDTYADKDDANVIGPEGFEQLCHDAHLALEGTQPLIFAWQMGAKEMAKITKEEWSKGTNNLKISSTQLLSSAVAELEQLLITGKPAVKGGHTDKDADYDRALYHTYAADPKAAFQKLYQFSFALAKPEQSKNIDMETSVALWNVLLVPKYPIMVDVLQFINEKGTYKATNKDLWSMMLEFCETVSPDLHDYEADGAWPTLLDDFFVWKKGQTDNGHADGMAIDQ